MKMYYLSYMFKHQANNYTKLKALLKSGSAISFFSKSGPARLFKLYKTSLDPTLGFLFKVQPGTN